MGPLGVHMELLIGPTVAVPAPPDVTDALTRVEVRHADEGRSGFQLQFESGRELPFGLVDHPLLQNPLLRPFNRVMIVVTFDVVPIVLMDGVITNIQLAPSDKPGASTVTVTGEDVSVMMDMEEQSQEWPAMADPLIALLVIAKYALYGLIPMVIPPLAIDQPNPVDRTPVQQGTDLQFLQELAGRYGYVFFVLPGPAPFTNTAYWGPRMAMPVPQRALRVGMGPQSNVASLNFAYDALKPELVEGETQDPLLAVDLPVMSVPSLRPPLAAMPAVIFNQPNVRRRQYRESGVSTPGAYGRAQGMTDASTEVVQATGEVDGLAYGDVLRTHGLVGVAGAGYSNDGFYYVKQVSHRLSRGEYKQSFTLTREGTGSTTPAVGP